MQNTGQGRGHRCWGGKFPKTVDTSCPGVFLLSAGRPNTHTGPSGTGRKGYLMEQNCANCGKPLKPEAAFCSSCGTPVGPAAPPPVEEPMAPVPPQAFTPPAAPTPAQEPPAAPVPPAAPQAFTPPVAPPPAEEPAAPVAPQAFTPPVAPPPAEEPAAPTAPQAYPPPAPAAQEPPAAPVPPTAPQAPGYAAAPAATPPYGSAPQQPTPPTQPPYGAAPGGTPPYAGTSGTPPQAPATPPYAGAQYGAGPGGPAVPGTPTAPGAPPPPPKKKSKTPLIIIIVAAVVLAAIGIGAFVVTSNNNKARIQEEYNVLATRITTANSPSRVAGYKAELAAFKEANPSVVEDDLVTLVDVCEAYKNAGESDARYQDALDELGVLTSSSVAKVASCASTLETYVQEEYEEYLYYQQVPDPPVTGDPGSDPGQSSDPYEGAAPWTMDSLSAVLRTSDGREQFSMRATNTSGKGIDYFEMWVYCYDSEGNRIYGSDGTAFDWVSDRASYAAGYTHSPEGNGYWTFENCSDVSIAIMVVSFAEFSDGTTWGVSDYNYHYDADTVISYMEYYQLVADVLVEEYI